MGNYRLCTRWCLACSAYTQVKYFALVIACALRYQVMRRKLQALLMRNCSYEVNRRNDKNFLQVHLRTISSPATHEAGSGICRGDCIVSPKCGTGQPLRYKLINYKHPATFTLYTFVVRPDQVLEILREYHLCNPLFLVFQVENLVLWSGLLTFDMPVRKIIIIHLFKTLNIR